VQDSDDGQEDNEGDDEAYQEAQPRDQCTDDYITHKELFADAHHPYGDYACLGFIWVL